MNRKDTRLYKATLKLPFISIPCKIKVKRQLSFLPLKIFIECSRQPTSDPQPRSHGTSKSDRSVFQLFHSIHQPHRACHLWLPPSHQIYFSSSSSRIAVECSHTSVAPLSSIGVCLLLRSATNRKMSFIIVKFCIAARHFVLWNVSTIILAFPT